MIDILRQVEAVPAAYPDAPAGLSDAAAALDAAIIWARIESYISHRFTVREIVWTVSGFADDEFSAPIGPLQSQVAQKWVEGAWTSTTLADGPMGLILPSDGTFQITAQVGAGPVPAPVSGAFVRLAEYWADAADRAGVSNYSVNIGGAVQESYERSPVWQARAMVNSGAADLLRPYRSHP